MAEHVPIRYRDFYDYPRIFVVKFRGEDFLFDAAFDEAQDEYANEYSIYRLDRLSEADLAGSWHALAQQGQLLGHVGVGNISFDSTRRLWIDASVLVPFARRAAS
jgi:hypothetical protein